MYFIIDKLLFDERQTNKIMKAIKDSGHTVYASDYYPPINPIMKLPKTWDENIPKIVYGSFRFATDYVRRHAPDNVVGFINSRVFDTTHYLSHSKNKENFLNYNNDIKWLTFDMIETNIENLLQNGPIFIRPNKGSKSFTGLVITKENYDHEFNSLKKLSHVSKEELILISKPQLIKNEYRSVVTKEKVITGCKYMENNEIKMTAEFPKKVEAFIAEHIQTNEFHPDSLYICDVAELDNGELKVIEYNAFSHSDLYECDIGKAMVTAADIITKEYE